MCTDDEAQLVLFTALDVIECVSFLPISLHFTKPFCVLPATQNSLLNHSYPQ
jgi:hypothetical protein